MSALPKIFSKLTGGKMKVPKRNNCIRVRALGKKGWILGKKK